MVRALHAPLDRSRAIVAGLPIDGETVARALARQAPTTVAGLIAHGTFRGHTASGWHPCPDMLPRTGAASAGVPTPFPTEGVHDQQAVATGTPLRLVHHERAVRVVILDVNHPPPTCAFAVRGPIVMVGDTGFRTSCFWLAHRHLCRL